MTIGHVCLYRDRTLQETDRNGQKHTTTTKLKRTKTNRNLPKRGANIIFFNLKYLNVNVNIVSKILIIGAHEAIPCAPEFSVFGTLGAHDHCSCAFSDFKISDFGLFPCYQGGYPR